MEIEVSYIEIGDWTKRSEENNKIENTVISRD